MASGKGVEAAKGHAAQLINDLQEISFSKVGLIIVGTALAIFAISKLFPYMVERAPSKLRLYLLGAVPIARLVLLIIAILWIIPIIFDVTLQNFLVISGAVGVAVGFAFKDYVSSLLAGVIAIFESPYRPGDWVEIGGDYGEVTSVGMRALTIRTPSDDQVSVPHNQLWTSNISNSNNGSHTLMCIAPFYVAPDHDARAIRAALADVARTSPYLKFNKPIIVVLKQTPWGTKYEIKAYPFDMRHQFLFVSDLTARGKAAISRAGGTEVCAAAVGTV